MMRRQNICGRIGKRELRRSGAHPADAERRVTAERIERFAAMRPARTAVRFSGAASGRPLDPCGWHVAVSSRNFHDNCLGARQHRHGVFNQAGRSLPAIRDWKRRRSGRRQWLLSAMRPLAGPRRFLFAKGQFDAWESSHGAAQLRIEFLNRLHPPQVNVVSAAGLRGR
jgi:hypothetical protein